MNEYLTALQTEDFDTAYNFLSEDFKYEQSKKEFKESLEQILNEAGGVVSYKIKSIKESKKKIAVIYELKTTLGRETWQALLVNEDGWKIDNFRQISSSYPQATPTPPN